MTPNQVCAFWQLLLLQQLFGPEVEKDLQPFIFAYWGCSMPQRASTLFD